MDTPINPDSLLVATASLAHLGHPDVSALIGLANNLNKEISDIYLSPFVISKLFTSVLTMSLKVVSR